MMIEEIDSTRLPNAHPSAEEGRRKRGRPPKRVDGTMKEPSIQGRLGKRPCLGKEVC